MVAGLCRLRAHLLSLFLLIAVLPLVVLAATDISETNEQLSQLKEQIDAIQARLDASEKERDTLQRDLRAIDLQIGDSDVSNAPWKTAFKCSSRKVDQCKLTRQRAKH